MNRIKIILGLVLVSQTVMAESLQEFIKFGLENNRYAEAIQLRMQSASDRLKAQKISVYSPSLSISSSFSQSRSKGDFSTTTSNSLSYGVNGNLNIYNGGSDVAGIKAAEARFKALDATYNSSKSFIRNTNADTANNIFHSYLSLSDSITYYNFYSNYVQLLEKSKKVAVSAEQLQRLQQRIDSQKVNIQQYQNNMNQNTEALKFYSYNEQADFGSIDSTLIMTNSIQIPETADIAVEEAMNNSPDVNITKYNLEAAKYEREADKGRLFRPRVDLQVGTNVSSFDSGGSQFDSSSSYVGLSVSYSLDGGIIYRNNASANSLAAAESENIATIDNLKFDLKSSYLSLKNLSDTFRLTSQNLAKDQALIENVIRGIEQGQKYDFEAVLGYFSSYSSNFQSAQSSLYRLAISKFEIQKTIGTLFSEVKVDPRALKNYK